jgi:hypothetical protein
MENGKMLCAAVVATGLLLNSAESIAGTITVTQRESSAGNYLWAGSGGAAQTSDESHSTTALSGLFSFSDTGSVQVNPGDPFSGGGATAIGSLTASDNVAQSSSSVLNVTATRTASGEALWQSGTGNAQSFQNQYTRVRFSVNGDNANFSLTGPFDPGFTPPGIVVGEAYSVRLYRPFTANVLVDVDSAEVLNESGLLLAGLTYELEIALNDRNSASPSKPSQSDASNFNIQFSVVSIPEPSAAMLAGLGGLYILAKRRRRN